MNLFNTNKNMIIKLDFLRREIKTKNRIQSLILYFTTYFRQIVNFSKSGNLIKSQLLHFKFNC